MADALSLDRVHARGGREMIPHGRWVQVRLVRLRVAWVDGHRREALVGESPESRDLGAHFLRPQAPVTG
jgi:hypothetical protein